MIKVDTTLDHFFRLIITLLFQCLFFAILPSLKLSVNTLRLDHEG